MTSPGGMAPVARQPREMAVLDGVLERVTFANPETGYTIARIAPDRGTGRGPVSASTELVTAVGPLLGAQVGESLRLRGRWTSHPKYGRQFDVHSYTTVLPATEQGIRRYLGSGLIKGIGPVMAERMVNHFGVDIMHIIDEAPQRLIEVDGLGPKRTERITKAWAEQKAIKEVMIFLQGVGVSTSLAVKIYKKYGDESIETVKQEPYRLAADVWGIGFKTADTIAASVGIARDSPERIKAGLAYTLSEAADDDGHCYLPEPALVTQAAKILDVPADLIAPCLAELAADSGVVREEVPAPAEAGGPLQAVYLPPFYYSERSLAAALRRLLSSGADRLAAFQTVDWEKAFGWLRGRTGTDLAPEQADAVKLALTGKVAVLTGGPGCGKSFTVRSVIELARARNAKVVLAAPTGRAAKRLAELTGHDAATIHRLLQLQPGRRARLRRRPPARRRPHRGGRDVDGRRDPREQAGQGGAAGRAPAAGRGRGPAAFGRRRGGAARPDRRRDAPRGPADEDLPAGAAVRHRRQRPQDQRRTAARAARLPRLLLVHLRRDRSHRPARHRHRRPPHPGEVRPRPAPRRPGALPDAPRPRRARET